MFQTRRIWVGLLLLAFTAGTAVAAAGPQLSAEQQQAADKLKAKGGSVMQLAADTDALAVNLGLAGKAIGDDELALVKTLPKVVELDLHGTAVTDAGLANLEGMKDLTRLRLDRTKVGDAGVAHLKDLSNLTYLNLYETPVTDAGLDSLKGLKNLKKLYLWQTKVTDAGAESLHKALPDVTINRGEGMAALAAVKPPEEKKPDNKPTATKTDKKPDDKKPDAKKDDKKTASAGESKPDDEGFIRTWLILAPIPVTTPNAGATEVDHEFLPSEKELKPKEGDKAKVGDKELAWKAVKANDYQFDLNEIVGQPTEQSVAYAVVYIDPGENERKGLTLAIGSDDQAKVYLNGKQIIKTADPRALAKDQDKAADLTLNKGTNVLVFKIINEGGGWQGCARFTDKEGKPAKDLKLRLAP
jgi:hypothetical protein